MLCTEREQSIHRSLDSQQFSQYQCDIVVNCLMLTVKQGGQVTLHGQVTGYHSLLWRRLIDATANDTSLKVSSCVTLPLPRNKAT